MSSEPGEGAGATQDLITRLFLEEDALITLTYGDMTVSQFLTTIDDVETDFAIDDLGDDEADDLESEEWDRRARSITIYGETVEATEAEGGTLPTSVTLVVDDPAVVNATLDGDQLSIWAGGEWVLTLRRLREPLRHRTHELIHQADEPYAEGDDEDA